MRIDSIALTWFRGAANSAILQPNCKSLVVFGENGSGKSSFVDAIEYVMRDGKIGHLEHKYSGRRQEKGVLNTHRPEGSEATLEIKLQDGAICHAAIDPNGVSSLSATAMDDWDYRRTILRQDEVARFITATKGDKYSALLPVFGLDHIEIAAENLRQLAKRVERESQLASLIGQVQSSEAKRRDIFGESTYDDIVRTIETLHGQYCPKSESTVDCTERCDELEKVLESRTEKYDTMKIRYATLKELADVDYGSHIVAIRQSNSKMAETVEPFVAEKLTVLDSTEGFVANLEDGTVVVCPSCGRPIGVEEFREHVAAEMERVKDLMTVLGDRRAAVNRLCDCLGTAKSCLAEEELASWIEGLPEDCRTRCVPDVEGVDPDEIRKSVREDDLARIERALEPLVNAAKVSSASAPADVSELFDDHKRVGAAKVVIKGRELSSTIVQINDLMAYLNALEQGLRDEIRQQSQKVIEEITDDVQVMWSILHPGEAIEGVRLYVPDDSDKAIDICLTFHGVDQDSPRLTLSEGHRNSLGLCIFLAMAKREAGADRPVILDDVVVSLDRNHRGMIAEILEKLFSERQVILLTHDLHWYMELRHHLLPPRWQFKTLMAFDRPDVGIWWSERRFNLSDARAHLKDSPDIAGSTARKIMDTELAFVAERLHLRNPHLCGEKNDHRMAHEFAVRLAKQGKKCYRIKDNGKYETHSEAIQSFEKLGGLLASWANTSAHTFDIVPSEAEKLVAHCEAALDAFECSVCGKPVYMFDDSSRRRCHCQCEGLRWAYDRV